MKNINYGISLFISAFFWPHVQQLQIHHQLFLIHTSSLMWFRLEIGIYMLQWMTTRIMVRL